METPIAEAYVASATAHAHSTIPVNLPVANPVIGYEAFNAPELGEESLELNDLENQAHAKKVLLSSDAMRYFIAKVASPEDRISALEAVIAKARVSFPSEDGWVVLNLARMEELVDALPAHDYASNNETNTDLESSVSYEAMTASSLAEALVMGNRKASFELITNRPMIALADAVSDMDALYRSRHGEVVTISNMLRSESNVLGTEIIAEMLEALTSALDGTFTNEEEAVKHAIEKAIAVLQR